MQGENEMVFSSLIFISVFLPIVLVIYYTVCRNNILAQNILLLLASLFFYAWGEPKFVLVMILSISVNYFFGLAVKKTIEERCKQRIWLVISIVFNLGVLFIFKYLNFTIHNLNKIFTDAIPQTSIALPIGISFFTFQAMSYVIDIYRGNVEVQKNPVYLALYISFFPQLIAGPIVRYSTIELQITNRTTTVDDFADGIRRFLIGFSKKIILANNFALIADQAFTLIETENLSIAFAWLGSLSYTLQIFFDFSAYSDMAIGLGKMFGFHFLENFNYPYISSSVSEFWRRWHISLGMWFRDYVYIPLGGSHVEKKMIMIRNLFVVWLLTGIWHGANWTFIIWGLWYFVLLTFEKITKIPRKLKSCCSRLIYGLLTFVFVNTGWVLFRADSIYQAIDYLKSMIGFGIYGKLYDNMFFQYFCENWILISIGIIYSVGAFKYIENKIDNYGSNILSQTVDYSSIGVYLMLFIVSISYLVMGSYNPFIYFNF